MAGILDFLTGGDGSQNGLLEFLRANAANQPMSGGLLSDTANYGQAPPPPQGAPVQPMAMAGPNQPSPLDTAQWPAGPIGAPSNASAAMPKAAPMSFAPEQPQAAAPAVPSPSSAAPFSLGGSGGGFGDRLMQGTRGFIGNLHNGPIGALAGGLGALVTGKETDPSAIEQGNLNATAKALMGKGATQGEVQAAAGNPTLMTALVQKYYGTGDRDFAFRQEEARRAQTNADRTFTLAERAATRADEGPVETSSQRAQAAEKFGLVPGTPEYKAYTLTGKLPEGDTTISSQVSQRQAAAAQMGMKPDHPAYQSFILTGKMPREDAQPLTATDKKAILEADEKVQSGRMTIDNLNKAKVLSKEAFSGPMAGKLGYAASFLGESSDTGKSGIATQDLENLITTNALQQLRAIFGGNPTEGERGILLDIQGSVGKPDAVRQKIYDRAIEAANKRLTFERQRADELRGGQFYKPQGGTSAAPAAAAAPTAQPQASPVKIDGYTITEH